MKKSKVLFATLTVAAVAIGCGVFAACNNQGDDGYTITFNANGGTYADNETTVTVKTDENGTIAAKPTDPVRDLYTFLSYNTSEDGTGETVTYGTDGYVFSKDSTVYAQWLQEYAVTFNAGEEGELPAGTSATVATKYGKLSSLPTPETEDQHDRFVGWYTAEENGELVTADYEFTATTTLYAVYQKGILVTLDIGTAGTLENTVLWTADGTIELEEPSVESHWYFLAWYKDAEFTTAVDEDAVYEEDVTLYAKYTCDDGIYEGNTFIAGLLENTGNEDTTYVEYWFGAGNSVTLEAESVLTIYLEGSQYKNFWLNGTCVDLSADVNGYGGINTDTVTITKTASFVVYLKVYANGGNNFQFNGTLLGGYEETSELPTDAFAITVSFGNGDITLYMIDSQGTIITAENAGTYIIYGWEDGGASDLFGGWTDSPTLDGTIATENDLYDNTNIKIHWTADKDYETNGANKFTVGNSYVVNYQTGDVYIYVPAEG